MAPQMKGLQQFIMDLRNSADVAEETRRIQTEISNVRAKFAAQSLDSYSKRKYLCKLLYIHLSGLTSEAAFGLEQAYKILSAPQQTYSEKSLAYTAVSILYSSEHTGHGAYSRPEYLVHMVEKMHFFLLRDLNANDNDTNILALQFIASNFNVVGGYQNTSSAQSTSDSGAVNPHDATTKDLEKLMELIYGLCVSPIAPSAVKMRALVALTVTAKAHPSFLLENDPWIPRLLSLLDERDLGVVTCAVPLVGLLTQLQPRHSRAIMPQIASLLYALSVDETCPNTYRYYEVPAPWLTVRLLQLAEHVLAHTDVSKLDQETLNKLRQSVSKSIQNASLPVQGQSDRNSRSAILFQAVALAPFLDARAEAIHGAIHALCSLLSAPETNTRFLVLDALVKLCMRTQHTAVFREHLPEITASLHDRDVSVRRKTLDLLFTACDEDSYTRIVTCLLDFLPHAESSLKTDISVKIAVLAERFATDSLWYVSTMLRLLSLNGNAPKSSGGHAEVWERIVQIIVNNADLQKMAAKYVVNLLKNPENEPAEGLIQVASFIIGEFGHTLLDTEVQAENGQYGLETQFRILSSSYSASSVSVRPLILSAFLKFVMKYPQEDFVPEIIDLFEAETRSLDLEIQTRATEYLKVALLLTGGDEFDVAFAKSLVQPLAPFESKENKLLGQLGSLSMKAGPSSSSINVSKIKAPKLTRNAGSRNGFDRSVSPGSVLSEEHEADPFGDSYKPPQLSPNWYDGYYRMLHFDVGIFYEDAFVKLTYRITRDGPTLKIAFTIINNAAKTAETAISAFTVHDVHAFSNSNYLVGVTKVPESKIPQKTTLELEAKIRGPFDNKDAPILAMSYKCSGSFNTLTLKVPVVLTKSLSGTSMSSIDDFKKRWLQIGELLGTERGEHRGLVMAKHRRTSSTVAKMLQRLGLAIIQSTPDEPNANILVMGAGILRMVTSNCGVLVTIKTIRPDSNEFDVIVRSTGESVPAIVFDTIRELLDLKH